MGMPFLVSLNCHALYPTELLAVILNIPARWFFPVDAALHLGGAGIGAYTLLRHAGRTGPAALLGGVTFAFGTHLFGLTGVGIPWIRDLSWLPWLFVALERLRAGDSLRWSILAGAAIGLPILTAGLQYAALATPVAVLWLVISRRPGPAIALAAVAIGLGAVLWIPGLEYAGLSVRANPGLFKSPLATTGSLRPDELITFLIPGRYGPRFAYFGPRDLPALPLYLGLLPTVLAVIGAAGAWRTDRRWLLLGLAGFILAFGTQTPLGALLGTVPPYSGFRGAERWLMFTHLAGAWFAGRGLEALPLLGRAVRTGAGTLLVAFAVACLGSLLLTEGPVSVLQRPECAVHVRRGEVTEARVLAEKHRVLTGTAVRAGASAAALATGHPAAIIIVTLADLLDEGLRQIRFGPAPPSDDLKLPGTVTGRVHSTEPLTMPNRRMASGLRWTFGYHGLPLERAILLKLLATTPPPLGNPAAFGLMDVEWIVEPSGTRRAPVKPPAAVRHPVVVGSADEALAVMRAADWTPDRAPVEAGGMRVPSGGAATVALAGASWAVTATRPALVVLPLVWYPAWRAGIDGARVPVFRADLALRAVTVPAGTHQVTFAYVSPPLQVGIWLTFLTLGALGGLIPPGRRGYTGSP